MCVFCPKKWSIKVLLNCEVHQFFWGWNFKKRLMFSSWDMQKYGMSHPFEVNQLPRCVETIRNSPVRFPGRIYVGKKSSLQKLTRPLSAECHTSRQLDLQALLRPSCMSIFVKQWVYLFQGTVYPLSHWFSGKRLLVPCNGKRTSIIWATKKYLLLSIILVG